MIKSLAPGYSFYGDGLTQSLFSDYMLCPRKFAIETHKLAQPSKFVMELGSAGHSALENGGKLGLYKFDRVITKNQKEQIHAILTALIPAYLKYYAKEDEHWSSFKEYVFDFMFMGVRLRGKIDGIMYLKHIAKIRETKFKSRISEDGLERGLALDWQSLFYVFAYAQVFKKHPIGGVEYDVIRYPTVKDNNLPKELHEKVLQGINDEPENWFKRWETKFTEYDICIFKDDLIAKLIEITNRKVWYRNECSCHGAYPCNFIDYCTQEDTSNLIKRELFSELRKQ
jgi:hypothetical protein